MTFPRLPRAALGWFAAGALLYGLFLLVYLPASFVADITARLSQNHINVFHATGSAWQGQGVLVVRLPGVAPVTLGTLAWDLRLTALLLARLRIDMQLSGGPVAANAQVLRTIRSWQLRLLDAQLDAARLVTLFPALGVAALEGQIRLAAPWIRLSRAGLHGDGSAMWEGAGSANFGLQDLGDYRAQISGDHGPLRLVITTLKGDVVVTGQGNWESGTSGQLQLALTIEPRSRQAALAPLLQTWTKTEAPGRYRLDINTAAKLPPLL